MTTVRELVVETLATASDLSITALTATVRERITDPDAALDEILHVFTERRHARR